MSTPSRDILTTTVPGDTGSIVIGKQRHKRTKEAASTTSLPGSDKETGDWQFQSSDAKHAWMPSPPKLKWLFCDFPVGGLTCNATEFSSLNDIGAFVRDEASSTHSPFAWLYKRNRKAIWALDLIRGLAIIAAIMVMRLLDGKRSGKYRQYW